MDISIDAGALLFSAFCLFILFIVWPGGIIVFYARKTTWMSRREKLYTITSSALLGLIYISYWKLQTFFIFSGVLLFYLLSTMGPIAFYFKRCVRRKYTVASIFFVSLIICITAGYFYNLNDYLDYPTYFTEAESERLYHNPFIRHYSPFRRKYVGYYDDVGRWEFTDHGIPGPYLEEFYYSHLEDELLRRLIVASKNAPCSVILDYYHGFKGYKHADINYPPREFPEEYAEQMNYKKCHQN